MGTLLASELLGPLQLIYLGGAAGRDPGVSRPPSHAAALPPTWGPERGHPPQRPHDSPGSRLQMLGG